jgi:hypothetical protein
VEAVRNKMNFLIQKIEDLKGSFEKNRIFFMSYKDLVYAKNNLQKTEEQIFQIKHTLSDLYLGIKEFIVFNDEDKEREFLKTFPAHIEHLAILKQLEVLKDVISYFKFHFNSQKQDLEKQLSLSYSKIAALESRSSQLEDLIKKQNETVLKARDEWQSAFNNANARLNAANQRNEFAEEETKNAIINWLKTKPKAYVSGYESLYEREMSIDQIIDAIKRDKWRM